MEIFVDRARHVRATSLEVVTGSLILLTFCIGGIVRAEPGDNHLISVDLTSGRAAGESSLHAVPNRDGRYIAFTSLATNLVVGGTNGTSNVFLHDRASGITERVSVGMGGMEPDDGSSWPLVSADGRYVAFSSEATNLVAGDDEWGTTDVFMRDRVHGVTREVSLASDGASLACSAILGGMSDDGRFVAFGCDGGVVLRDVVARTTTQIVAIGSPETAAVAGLSGNGRYVLYHTYDEALGGRLYLYDRITATTAQLGRAPPGYGMAPSMSRDGRWVVYTSVLVEVTEDTNENPDVFLLDRWTGQKRRVSVSSTGQQSDAGGFGPLSVSDDGRLVVFWSSDGQLALGAEDGYANLLIKDMETGAVEFVTKTYQGSAALSGDGRLLGFVTTQPHVPTDLNSSTEYWGLDTYVHEVGRSSDVPSVYSYNLRPRSIDFGEARVSSTLRRGFRLVNVGFSTLPVTTAEILGNDRAQFRLRSYCPSALPPAQQCWIELTFEPTGIGVTRARLHVVAGGIERNRSLSGVGVR